MLTLYFIKLRLLRDTIPSLMRTIHVEHSSPEELYTDISRTAVKAVTNIKNFIAVLQEPYSQEVLLKAKESHAESNEGIMTWLVTQHPKWLDKLEDDTKDLRLDVGAGQNGDKGEELEQEDVPTIISKFQEEHTNLGITIDQEHRTLQVGHIIVQYFSLHTNFIRSASLRQPEYPYKSICNQSLIGPPCILQVAKIPLGYTLAFSKLLQSDRIRIASTSS